MVHVQIQLLLSLILFRCFGFFLQFSDFKHVHAKKLWKKFGACMIFPV